MATKSKVFLSALELISHDAKLLRKTLKDRRLNLAEKKILEGYLMLRDNLYDEVISLLSTFKAEDPFVEDHRLQVLAGAYNNKFECLEAWKYFEKSHELRKKNAIVHGQFKFLICFFYIALNLQKEKEARDIFKEIHASYSGQKKDLVNYIFCRYRLTLLDKDLEQAKTLLQELKSLFSEMSAMNIINYHFLEFNLCLELKDFEAAYGVLETLKNHRKYRTNAEYKFMKGLLDSFSKKKPIYLYEQDYQDSPVLLYELQVLKAFEQNHPDEATVYWSKLQALSPWLYGDHFVFHGQTCIFKVCLDHYLSMLKVLEHTPNVIADSYSKEDRVIQLLSQSENGISKEKVYSLIYGQAVETKEDLNKLKTLVSSVRKRKSINIKSRKGCYFIAS